MLWVKNLVDGSTQWAVLNGATSVWQQRVECIISNLADDSNWEVL